MSEFQAALAIIGVLAIVGVFAYNKWQERRARREAQATFASRHADILMDDARAGSREHGLESTGIRIEPGFAPSDLPVAERAKVGGSESALPDPRVDYVIELTSTEAISVGAMHDLWAAAHHRFAGRATFAAWIDGQWALLPQGGNCEKLRAAFQLVSRSGVVTEAEVLEFRSTLESMAAKLGASAAAPEMRESLDAARELDSVCAQADIQIAFHVVAAPGATFAGTKLRAAAEAAGFALDSSGRFELRDEQGRELYAVMDRAGSKFTTATMKDAAPQAVTLSMDVPRAPDTQRTFEAMVRFGRHLAALMGGTLVDDNGQPLDERAVAAIDAQLILVRRGLEERGIAPGSALALRVFS